jgi:hypothetical protein
MPSVTFDGPYGQVGGYQIGSPSFDYPFEANGDMDTVIVTRSYKQTPDAFVADRAAGTFTPGVYEDPEYPGAYLMATSKPQETRTGLYSFTRVFATVPTTQTIPGSLFVTKPVIPGTFPQIIGDSLVLQPDPTVPTYTFNTRKTVTSDSGAPSASNYPTGGTYTITIGGQTTAAIAYNANASTVQTAINALSGVSDRGGVVVTGSYNSADGFLVSFNSYAAGSFNSSLTGTGGNPIGVYTPTLTTLGHFQLFAAGSVQTGVEITGGTFTLTFFGQTTSAIAHNALASDVQTAVQALSKIGASGIVIPDQGLAPGILGGGVGAKLIRFTVNIQSPSFSGSGTSLTPSGSYITVGSNQANNTNFYIKFAGVTPSVRTIVINGGHGISDSDSIYILQGGVYVNLSPGSFVVIDANTIQFDSTSGGVFLNAGTITAVGKQTGATYTAGTKLTRCKRVTDYYLPGVTPGIATADDIPLPVYQGDAGSLLEAIFSGSTAINYEVGELVKWRDWPILQRTTTTLNASQL